MSVENRSPLPALTGAEMAAVDRAMFDRCGLDVLQVMEVAGRAVAAWIRSFHFRGELAGRRIVLLCGPGGNGGDGFVAARYLHGWGAKVVITVASMPAEESPTAHNFRVVRTLGIDCVDVLALSEPESSLIVDGLLGFGGTGEPRGRIAALIDWANAQRAPIVAIDNPSGLDATTGEVHATCIAAQTTITLGLPKTGLLSETARGVAGRTIVADIGIPAEAYTAAGLEIPHVIWRADFVEI
ncbi:MAG: NAD(P)H-hydrate epimerase [Thermomicrobiales bacterium]